MDRQNFMDIVYSELESDHDNNRANRIIWAADGYAERRVDDVLQVIKESVQLGTNLAEVGTDCISRRAVITQLSHNKNKGDEEWKLAVENDIQTVWQSPPIQPKRGKCKWCERLKERNLRIEYYWIGQEGCTASFSEPHIVATGIAKFCPNCGAKLTEGDAE